MVLAVCLAVLVVLLAALQWRWLDEIEGHEHYRRERRVGYATWLFKEIFDHEIVHLARSMAAPAGLRAEIGADTGAALAARLERWRRSTRWPGLPADVYVVAPGPGTAELALARLEPRVATLEPVAWPPALHPLEATLAEIATRWPPAPPTDFRVLPSVPALLLPSPHSSHPNRPSMLLLLLDEEYMARHLFPELVGMVFPPPTFDAIDVAVAEAATGRVLYSTLEIDHSSEFGAADAVYGLVPEGAEPAELRALPPLRPGVRGIRPTTGSLVIPSSQRQPTPSDEEWFGELWSRLFYSGHWQVLVRRGEIPIPEEVAAMRRRKMTAAFGLLALLSTSIALLTASARRTQRAAREQMERLARVSHELRTPLSVLSSAGDNLADAVVSGEEQVRQYGRVIQAETRRLHELVENVLHLSRRRAGAPALEPHRVDLVKLVEDSLGSAEPSLRQAGFTVERSLPPRPVEILGEPRALCSAVLNLISNGIKYGRSARWLRLAVEEDDGHEVRIVVEDRGPGIARSEIPELFKPYTRGERAMTDQTEGSGLGLAVVKEVVEAHAGRISVHSPAGGGTAFTLHFPLAEPG